MDQDSQQSAHTHRKKVTGRTKLALSLILGPTVLFALCFILFAVTNTAGGNIPSEIPDSCTQVSIGDGGANDQRDCTDELFGKTTASESTINTLIFFFAGVAILTWLPGLIAGIILLAKKPNNTETPVQ